MSLQRNHFVDYRAGAFVDLDGTLVKPQEDRKFPSSPEDFQLIEPTFEVLAELVHKGMKPIIVSNQGGIQSGHVVEYEVHQRVQRMKAMIRKKSLGEALIQKGWDFPFYYTSDASPAYIGSKPNPGMGYKAAMDHGLILRNSVMIGDAPSHEDRDRTEDKKFADNCGMAVYISVSAIQDHDPKAFPEAIADKIRDNYTYEIP